MAFLRFDKSHTHERRTELLSPLTASQLVKFYINLERYAAAREKEIYELENEIERLRNTVNECGEIAEKIDDVSLEPDKVYLYADRLKNVVARARTTHAHP